MQSVIFVFFALLVPPGNPTEIEFITPYLPWAITEKGYEAPPFEVRVSGTCPIGGVGYSVVSGSLPPGLQLSRLGYFSGAPLHSGEFQFKVKASDGCGSAEKEFTIVVTGAPVLTVTPLKAVFTARAGANPPEQEIRVSSTWPRLPYRLNMSNAAWLTATPDKGMTPREGSGMAADIVHLRVDTTALKPGKYTATILVSGWQVLEPVRVDVDLTVN